MVNQNISLIKEFFKKNLPDFWVVSENCYSMFWSITFENKELKVKISGDAGGFSITIFIDNAEFPLWQYDRSIVNATKTNNDNILIQLKVFKNFLDNV